jgi:hypothetical protein
MKSTIQDKLIELIKTAIPDHLKLADEIAETLNMSNDSAYRRIRGETALNIDEIAAICRQFSISFDSLIAVQDGGLVSFTYSLIYDLEDGFLKYIQNLKEFVNAVEKNNGLITWAAEDVPVFRSLSKPMLAEFKMFYWLKAVINDQSLQNQTFRPGVLPARYCELADEAYQSYSRVNSIEIWTKETLNSSLRQLEFFWESGQIEKREYALEICEQMRLMMAELAIEAEREHKSSGISDYNCDVLIGSNCIIVEAGMLKRTFISYNTMNSIYTGDKKFNQEAGFWMQNLIRKSTMLSGMAEKQRYQFFRNMETAIQQTIANISGTAGSAVN